MVLPGAAPGLRPRPEDSAAFFAILPQSRPRGATGLALRWGMDKVDLNLEAFKRRAARVEDSHARGFGFEALGTLGRQPVTARRLHWSRIVAPLLFLVVVGVLMKGALIWRIGIERYDHRIEQLLQEPGFDRLGGLLMQSDPATRGLALILTGAFPGI